ncbi:hypothetical protein ACFFNY_14175 [Paenibacillus hodogayensis]|uniref:Z-ring formation inhibitor MciZ n=1 Tax=Paenibacillus hodogayensis TaxID=279208 RepID=A0ABV5VXA9_9BACL
MPYYISYKGQRLGSPLTKQQAEEKLLVLSRCFKQLEITQEAPQPAMAAFIHGSLAENK